jgi:hypothetical protein
MPIVKNLYAHKIEDLLIAARAELGTIEASRLLLEAALEQLQRDLVAATEDVGKDSDGALDLSDAVNATARAIAAIAGY